MVWMLSSNHTPTQPCLVGSEQLNFSPAFADTQNPFRRLCDCSSPFYTEVKGVSGCRVKGWLLLPLVADPPGISTIAIYSQFHHVVLPSYVLTGTKILWLTCGPPKWTYRRQRQCGDCSWAESCKHQPTMYSLIIITVIVIVNKYSIVLCFHSR